MESAESRVLPFVIWPIQHRIARRGCPAWRDCHVRALLTGPKIAFAIERLPVNRRRKLPVDGGGNSICCN